MTTEVEMKAVDLHVHSDKSDGSLTPSQLVSCALSRRLAAFALTDHDTTDGIDEAVAAAEGTGLEVIPGIELSTEYEGKDVHILGLYIRHHAPLFRSQIQAFVDSRKARNEKMCGRLREAGVDISYEKLRASYPRSVITRGHYARYLLENGDVKSLKEAFDRYVGDHTPYFVPREKITPEQAVELILSADGLPILAHPILYRLPAAKLDSLVRRLREAGLAGLEALYSSYDPSEERDMRRLAAKYDLCVSGGSDFHGASKPGLELGIGYGGLFVPEEILSQLKDRLNNSPSAHA